MFLHCADLVQRSKKHSRFKQEEITVDTTKIPSDYVKPPESEVRKVKQGPDDKTGVDLALLSTGDGTLLMDFQEPVRAIRFSLHDLQLLTLSLLEGGIHASVAISHDKSMLN